MESVVERFLRYVSYETTSDEFSETCPSTPKQRLLGQQLVKEMLEMGIEDARIDENGYVYGSIPGDPALPVIGLIAHMDTAPDASGANIRAKIVPFDGSDICLNEEQGIYLRESEYPALALHHGKHLIVTDGTTLLGADDKAGVAEILAAAEYLKTARIKHATLKIAFTPDEEIGRGADRFDIPGFGADYAYTCDGGLIGEMEYETFNAAGATVDFKGLNIHPGSAKGKMVNAQYIAMEFQSLLPAAQKPEYTEGYEGFIHLTDMSGDVVEAELHYIIRDHDRTLFEEKKACLRAAVEEINRRYGEGTAEADISDTYYNMREKIEPHRHLLDRAEAAYRACGVAPRTEAIRGGTDGAVLTWMGLPCPNLSTGGYNYHGVREWIPVESLGLMTDVLVDLVHSFAEARV